MDLIKGYLHPVRQDINLPSETSKWSVTLEISYAPYLMAVEKEDTVDSVGVRIKLSIINKADSEEIIGFTVEAGVIFSALGSAEIDYPILKQIVEESFTKSITYIDENTPDNIFKASFVEVPDYNDMAQDVLQRLIDRGLY